MHYAVDQEKACSIFQIILKFIKKGGGDMDSIDLAKDRDTWCEASS